VIQKIKDKGIEIGCTDYASSTDILIKDNLISQVHAGIHLMDNTEAQLENNNIRKTKTEVIFSNPEDSLAYAQKHAVKDAQIDKPSDTENKGFPISPKALMLIGAWVVLLIVTVIKKRKNKK